MTIKKADLLERLRNAVTPAEWKNIINGQKLIVSTFNRNILLELKDVEIADAQKVLEKKKIYGFCEIIKEYLSEHMKDKPEGWKWIIVSGIYLSFIAERPLHPLDVLDIKVIKEEGKPVYECPCKSGDANTVCQYCVCRRMSNYEIMKRKMQKEFLKYDQEKMIRKFRLKYDSDYLFINFLGRKYRIHRKDGKIRWSDDDFLTSEEAEYNEAMTIYDVLCYSKDDCSTTGEVVNMKSLSAIQGGSVALGNGLFDETEKLFDHNDAALAQACERLHGVKVRKGDVSYRIPMFEFLPVIFQFWNSDEEFPASLQLFVDKNILDYMHYETVWFAMSHLLKRIKEELQHS